MLSLLDLGGARVHERFIFRGATLELNDIFTDICLARGTNHGEVEDSARADECSEESKCDLFDH